MSTRKFYHVNPETGRPNLCAATVRECAFAQDGEVPVHYENKSDAKAAGERMLSEQHGAFSTVKKKKKPVEKVSGGKSHENFGSIESEIKAEQPFAINDKGSVVEIKTPILTPSNKASVLNDSILDKGVDGWEPVTGFTNQAEYDGPLMNKFESMNGSEMESYVRENSGTYVKVHPLNGDFKQGIDSEYDRYKDDWVLFKKTDDYASELDNSIFTEHKIDDEPPADFFENVDIDEVEALEKSLVDSFDENDLEDEFNDFDYDDNVDGSYNTIEAEDYEFEEKGYMLNELGNNFGDVKKNGETLGTYEVKPGGVIAVTFFNDYDAKDAGEVVGVVGDDEIEGWG